MRIFIFVSLCIGKLIRQLYDEVFSAVQDVLRSCPLTKPWVFQRNDSN